MRTFFISYPKSGRNWTKSFLKRINWNKIGEYRAPIEKFEHDGMTLFDRSENYERSGKFDNLWNKKIIFVARNPRDVMVSFYYYAKYVREATDMNISEFIRSKFGIEQMMKFYDDWASLIENNKDRTLFIRYEWLREDPDYYFRKILDFIPIRYSEKNLQDALDYTSFETMKKREEEKKNTNDPRYLKIREGRIGNYVNHLSNNDINFIDKVMNEYDNFIVNYYK